MTFLGETLEGKTVLLFTENILFIEADEERNCVIVRLKEGVYYNLKLPEIINNSKIAVEWIADQLS